MGVLLAGLPCGSDQRRARGSPPAKGVPSDVTGSPSPYSYPAPGAKQRARESERFPCIGQPGGAAGRARGLHVPVVLGLQQLELVLDAVAGVGGRELQLLRQVRGALEQQETALGPEPVAAGPPPPRARPALAAAGAETPPGAPPGPGTRPRSPVGPLPRVPPAAPPPLSTGCRRREALDPPDPAGPREAGQPPQPSRGPAGARPRPAAAPAPGRAVPSAGFVETSCQVAARSPHGATRCRLPPPPRLPAPPPPLSAPGPAAPAPRPPRPGRAARPAPLPPPAPIV